jgi:ferredoxin
MTKIVLHGVPQALEAPVGASLLEAIQEADHPIATSCGGVATCALCRVTIKQGKELLSPINADEITHLGSVAKIVGLRLACQARVVGEGTVVVEVPEVEDVAAKKAEKAARLRQARNASPGGRRPG